MGKKAVNKSNEFELPRYLKLNKGAMWFDDDGENSSGVKVYAIKKNLISRKMEYNKLDNGDIFVIPTDIPKDEHDNKNLINFGTEDIELPWYFDTNKIPKEKLSRILIAYKYNILVEADPKKPTKKQKQPDGSGDFSFKDNGDRIFVGRNKEIYQKLQNNNFEALRKFITDSPNTSSARQNLVDLFDYEKKGYNALSRPRHEVLELIKQQISKFGPSITGIRINEEE